MLKFRRRCDIINNRKMFYTRDKRNGEFVFEGCKPIDLEEDVIEITKGVE